MHLQGRAEITARQLSSRLSTLQPMGSYRLEVRGGDAVALALSTLALFGYHALYFIALKRAPAVEANLLNYLWPLLIVVFAGLVGGVTVRAGQWAGTLLGLVAAALLVRSKCSV